MIRMSKYVLVSAVVLLVASCGGGGGDAGDAAEFNVFPQELKYKAGKGDLNCSNVDETIVFVVNGGQPPFRVINAHPERFSVDKTVLSGQDPQFKLNLLGGCGENLGVTVLDAHSQSFVVTITVEKGEENE